jgi:diguanylate cyclase (GGDEF)-like protein
MTSAFLFFDVLALLSVLFVALYVRGSRYRIAIVLIGLAILSITVGDRLYESQLLAKAIGPNGWVYSGWCLGWMVAALGARASRFILPDEQNPITAAESMSAWPLWRTLLPYVLVPLVGSLAYAVWDFTMQTPLVIGVEISFGALLGVVLVRQVLGEIENHRLQRDLVVANLRLAALSTTDPLTDLPNYRALAEVAEREIERARRFGRNLALLFCDVDRFKEVNDTLGHTVGDAVLREFGEIMRRGIRGNDLVGRWGGEEFLIISPESDLPGACSLAERLRAIVASHEFKNIPFFITCSIGIAVYPADATTYGTLIDAADRAMYLAKIRGRNQIRVASDPALSATTPELPDEPLSTPAATSR